MGLALWFFGGLGFGLRALGAYITLLVYLGF